MIEANEDITLVTEQQIRDVEQGQAQARAIAEGREVHPAILAAQAEADIAPPPPDTTAPPAALAHTIQRPAPPPPDPDAAARHIRLSIAVVVVLVLFLLWLRQRSANSAR